MKPSWKRRFAVIYAGQAFSIIGSAAVQFAIIWYLTLRTESSVTLTTAAIVGFLPTALLGPFAGVWIDRYNRRTVMMLADGLTALSSALLAIVFRVSGDAPVWFIYAVLFLRGVGTTFHAPAIRAAIPTFVPAEQLTRAGGWSSFITSGSNLLGPMLGAVLMETLPIVAVMLVDILGAAFAILCLAFVEIPDVPRQSEKIHFMRDMKDGVRALTGNRLLMAALPQIVLVGILYMPLNSLFPLLVLTHFGGGALQNGMVDVFFASGMLLSSVIMGIWGGTKRKFMLISLAIIIIGIVTAISGLLPGGAFWWLIVCVFIMGHMATYFNVPFYAYVQESTKPELLGKVMSLILTIFTLANPIGLALAGPLSNVIGVNQWFLYSGIALAAVGVLSLLRTHGHESTFLIRNSDSYSGIF